ncbi:hypothetical protein M9Y10_006235 [Tritrichomonas musculus]|uniref:Uncharacterized protein n=1 Tax=Tritrichomonas musculus TaxID=1915356 RepID=A0ABR2JE52_9EUKA
MLIKGEIIQQDIEQANECLSILGTTSDRQVLLLKGKICSKMDKKYEVVAYFKKGTLANNNECMYEYAKNLFLGEGTEKNVKEAF